MTCLGKYGGDSEISWRKKRITLNDEGRNMVSAWTKPSDSESRIQQGMSVYLIKLLNI